MLVWWKIHPYIVTCISVLYNAWCCVEYDNYDTLQEEHPFLTDLKLQWWSVGSRYLEARGKIEAISLENDITINLGMAQIFTDFPTGSKQKSQTWQKKQQIPISHRPQMQSELIAYYTFSQNWIFFLQCVWAEKAGKVDSGEVCRPNEEFILERWCLHLRSNCWTFRPICFLYTSGTTFPPSGYSGWMPLVRLYSPKLLAVL